MSYGQLVTHKPARSHGHLIRSLLTALALVMTLAGCANVDEAIDQLLLTAQEFEESSARPSPILITTATARCSAFIIDATEQAYHDALLAYAQSRVVPMSPADREPVLFSAWVAYEDLGAPEADPDGRLTLWDDDYFITHTWSYYGKRILTMIPGDNVEINDRLINVQGIFDYPKEAYHDELRALVGQDTVIIQTCEPDSNLNRIVYGVWSES